MTVSEKIQRQANKKALSNYKFWIKRNNQQRAFELTWKSIEILYTSADTHKAMQFALDNFDEN